MVGREDVDVRMLGTGRPFVIEFINPRRVTFRSVDMVAIQRDINALTSDVAVRDLQLVTKVTTQKKFLIFIILSQFFP